MYEFNVRNECGCFKKVIERKDQYAGGSAVAYSITVEQSWLDSSLASLSFPVLTCCPSRPLLPYHILYRTRLHWFCMYHVCFLKLYEPSYMTNRLITYIGVRER